MYLVKTIIKGNQELDTYWYPLSHQCCKYKPLILKMYRSASLSGIHLKRDSNAIPKPIFVPHPIRHIARRRKNNILNSIEVRIVHIKHLFNSSIIF